jgi:hypothetical protein
VDELLGLGLGPALVLSLQRSESVNQWFVYYIYYYTQLTASIIMKLSVVLNASGSSTFIPVTFDLELCHVEFLTGATFRNHPRKTALFQRYKL